MWFLIKRLPKLLFSLLVFITIFLLGFLLIGCMETPKTFSDAYLMKLEFNKSSPWFPTIEAAYSELNQSSLTNMLITASYLAMCVDLDDSLTCSSNINLSKLSSYSGVSLFPSKSNGSIVQIDLILVAKSFADSCYPRILVSTLVLTILLTIFVFWSSMPLLPGKLWSRRISCGLLALAVLVWGLGAMLQQQAVSSIKTMAGPASMYAMQVSPGKRAEALTWSAFSFLLICCIGLVALCIRDLVSAKNNSKIIGKV